MRIRKILALGVLIVVSALLVPSCLDPVDYSEPVPVPGDGSADTGDGPVEITITGITPESGKEIKDRIATVIEGVGVDIEWKGHADERPINVVSGVKFEKFEDYTATIYLYAKGGHSLPPEGSKVTVTGALDSSYNPATSVVTATFPRTHYPVGSVSDLNAAVRALRPLPEPDDPKNKNVIELTEAFYNTVNGNTSTPYYVSIGAATASNTIPYTVRGLGKDSPRFLNAGILVANNNITLEQVHIEITDKDRGVPREWAGSLYYRAAVLVRRYGDSNSPIAPAPKIVTVKNCNIHFTANNSMIAGIYINDGDDSIRDISIADNTVNVGSGAGYAAQALLIHRYDPSLSITGNGLKAQNTAATHGNPAGAILMQLHHNIVSSETPRISGNIINGSPTYDFYVNILSTGDRKGIPALFADKFATPDSKWMTAESTDTRSFYKKLVETLLSQSRAGAGYGYLAMYLDGTAGTFDSGDCVFEAYAQESNQVVSIDFWGYVINGNAYKTGGAGYADNVRARLMLNGSGQVTDRNAQFYWWAGTDLSAKAANMPTPL